MEGATGVSREEVFSRLDFGFPGKLPGKRFLSGSKKSSREDFRKNLEKFEKNFRIGCYSRVVFNFITLKICLKGF
jgi:hypothetical protein